MNIAPQVADLRLLLGDDVLLLPWLLGKKGGQRRWKHLTVEAMNDPAHLQKLGRGNIGVALGPVSGGLCSLDIDSDEEMEDFLKLNPVIGNTLRSCGSRGGNLWWRMDGDYPALTPLKRHGKPWGEWRSTGGQTIIYGQHPEGHQYEIVQRVKPNAFREFDVLVPEGQHENSPAFQRWVAQNHDSLSPEGTTAHQLCDPFFNRPFGTHRLDCD